MPFSIKYIQQSSYSPSETNVSSGVILLSLINGTVFRIMLSEKFFLKTTESFKTKLLASKTNDSFKLSLS